jgi:hypothetical protein
VKRSRFEQAPDLALADQVDDAGVQGIVGVEETASAYLREDGELLAARNRRIEDRAWPDSRVTLTESCR